MTKRRRRIPVSAKYRAGFHAALLLAAQQAIAPCIRTLREFAENEIVIPEGLHEGSMFRAGTQPFMGILLDAIDSGQWNRFAITGCVQSGKTLAALVLPVAYHIAEMKETVILAAPNMETAQDKWAIEILPVFERSPALRGLLPRRGAGSKGGTSESLQFTNGATLKFMSAGGGDIKRSAFTSRVLVVTEADKMDTATEVSREADPLKQLEARTASYSERRRIYLESTVSIEDGRIHQEYLAGTATELLCPCVHCERFVLVDREHLVGWSDAGNEVDAGQRAAFACPECGAIYSDDERRAMCERAELVHRGQRIENGRVVGDRPKTHTLGFRWNAFHNLLWSTPFIAEGEWKARRSEIEDAADAEDQEKQRCQWYWVRPYEPEDLSDYQMEATVIRRRMDTWPRDVVPPDTEHLTIGVDLGKTTCWWFAVAFRANKQVHVPAYGAFTPETDLDAAMEIALLNSLRTFRDDVVLQGFPVHGTDGRRIPDSVWIDAGWLPNVVAEFVRESGPMRGNRFHPMRGRGRSNVQATVYSHPKKKTNVIRMIRDHWYAEINRDRRVIEGTFDADYWKLWVQKRLVTKTGEPGAMAFYQASTKDPRRLEHSRVSRHLTNERYVREEVPGRGIVEKWEKKGQNHWLDAAAMACVGGNFHEFALTDGPAAKAAPRQENWFSRMQRAGT